MKIIDFFFQSIFLIESDFFDLNWQTIFFFFSIANWQTIIIMIKKYTIKRLYA